MGYVPRFFNAQPSKATTRLKTRVPCELEIASSKEEKKRLKTCIPRELKK